MSFSRPFYRNIDFLYCCSIHVHLTSVILSLSLQENAGGRGGTVKCAASSAVLCPHLPHTHKVYHRRFLCSISLSLFYIFKLPLCFSNGTSYRRIIFFLVPLVL